MTAPAAPIVRRIYVVEDHPVIQASYLQFIGREPDLEVCGMARRGDEALAGIEAAAPDLVMVDVSLPDMDGMDLVGQLRARFSDLPILVVSGREAARGAARALEAGAAGYIDKLDADHSLIPAIRRTLGLVES